MRREKLEKIIIDEILGTDNYKVALNSIESEVLEKIMDMICDKIENEEKLFNESLIGMHKLEKDINDLENLVCDKIIQEKMTDEALENIFLKLETFKTEFDKRCKEFNKKVEEYKKIIKEETLKEEDEIFMFMHVHLNLSRKLVTYLEDLQEYETRRTLISKRILNFLNDNSKHSMVFADAKATMEMSQITYESLKRLLERIKFKKEIKLEKYLKEVKRNKKIFDYKEMFRLAKKAGYIKERVAGDHFIFKHNETNKIVPIPAHSLGYGLMCDIQQLIRANAM